MTILETTDNEMVATKFIQCILHVFVHRLTYLSHDIHMLQYLSI